MDGSFLDCENSLESDPLTEIVVFLFFSSFAINDTFNLNMGFLFNFIYSAKTAVGFLSMIKHKP